MEEMRKILKALMFKHEDDAYSLETKSGVPQPTTQRFLSGRHGEPRSSTVRKWAHAYGLKESQLRGDEEITGLETVSKDVMQFDIKDFKKITDNLNDNQKQELEELMAHFVVLNEKHRNLVSALVSDLFDSETTIATYTRMREAPRGFIIEESKNVSNETGITKVQK